MELLKKTENTSDDPRQDNADKQELFGGGAAAALQEHFHFYNRFAR